MHENVCVCLCVVLFHIIINLFIYYAEDMNRYCYWNPCVKVAVVLVLVLCSGEQVFNMALFRGRFLWNHVILLHLRIIF